MRKILFLALLVFLFHPEEAKSQSPLPVGMKQFNGGIGFSDWGVPFYLGLDFSVHEDITVGGEFSYRSYHDNWNHYSYHHNIIGISGNGNYHFNTVLEIPQEWDFYAGLNLGFYIWSSPDDYHGDYTSGLDLGIQVGGRYYFNEKVGLNLEFKGGNEFSGGKLGVSIRF